MDNKQKSKWFSDVMQVVMLNSQNYPLIEYS